MSVNFALILALSCILLPINSQLYPYEKWIEDWSGMDANTYGVSIDNSTIFDIVLPGANKAGMSFPSDAISKSSNPELDGINTNILDSLNTIKEKQAWAARQKGSIYELLMRGARFLDFQFQHDLTNNEFYTYNGLLGRSVTEIISDINRFLTTERSKEIIIIYLHDFIYDLGDTSANEDDLKQNLMNRFVSDTDIYNKLANSNLDNINSRTIKDLTETDEIQIVIFSDDPNPGNDYVNANFFYDADEYLFIPKGNGKGGNNTDSNSTSFQYGQLDTPNELRAFVINNIRFGWPDNRVNLIYWSLDIGSSFTEQFLYSGMQHFVSGANSALNSVLKTYNKLWFANIIIVDFFETSDIMEQIILLNHQYNNCKDSIWGNNITGCPYVTRLDLKYLEDDISSFCSINPTLQEPSYCQRSCGACPNSLLTTGNPGDSCTHNTQCDSILYDFYDETGTCFIRSEDTRSKDNIAQESFCLSLNSQESCANKEIKEKCSNGNNTNAMDISLCNDYCTSNWQCNDGYCNTEYSVCMTLLEPPITTQDPTPNGPKQQYDFLTSEGAEIMLRDVAPFRPGDYQAPPDFNGVECSKPGPGCMLDGMNANPYIASLLGFAIIPFIMALLLCFCYTFCCCPCWCCCDQCGKKCCCCHKIMKDPIEDGDKCKHWTPFAFLASALIIVLWACIEGIVNNAEMHDHIFAENNSVKYAVNHLFNEVIERFEAVEPTSEFIIDFGIDIINDVFSIMKSNTDSVSGIMDKLYSSLGMVEQNYSNGLNISAEFINPFNNNGSFPNESFTIECPYCLSIADNAAIMKEQLNSSIGSQLGQIDKLINQTKQLVNAKDRIKNLTEVFFETLNQVINTSNEIQKQANDYIDLGAKYDTKYRQQPAQIFFLIPMALIIFVIAGVFMKNKWCMKCEWCCAMYCCGIPIMLLSWPFIFFAVLWGDLCVRLDDFENNLGHSQIGKLAKLDNISANDPRAMGMALVNTCWHGGSPLTLFNLTQTLNWDNLRDELDSVLDVDITGLLEGTDIGQFQAEIDTLSVDEFVGEVDGYIANANGIGRYCGCGAANVPFTRANLYTPPTFDFCAVYTPPNYTEPSLPYNITIDTQGVTFYWYNTTLRDDGKCQRAFINASAAIQIQTKLKDEATTKISNLKRIYSSGVFDTYDDLYEVALKIEADIVSVSCLIEPLFEQFDIIIDNFTNCGFLGEAYGNFKEAGCINLFDDWYKIARALALIAYISILIVFCSLCMDYIYGPVKKRLPLIDDLDDNDNQNEMNGDVITNANDTGQTNVVELAPQTYPSKPINYDDAAASDRYRTQSVASYSRHSHQPPPPSEPIPNASMYGVSNRPVIAESEIQVYQIDYDNEPINKLDVIPQQDEPEEGGMTTSNYNEPVVPTTQPSEPMSNPVVIGDDIDIVLKDSSDDD